MAAAPENERIDDPSSSSDEEEGEKILDAKIQKLILEVTCVFACQVIFLLFYLNSIIFFIVFSYIILINLKFKAYIYKIRKQKSSVNKNLTT